MFSSNCRILAAESRLSLELKTSPVEGLMQLGDEALCLRAQAESGNGRGFRHIERLHSRNFLDGLKGGMPCRAIR